MAEIVRCHFAVHEFRPRKDIYIYKNFHFLTQTGRPRRRNNNASPLRTSEISLRK